MAAARSRSKMSNNSEPDEARPQRQRIFNLPGIVLALAALLLGIHVLRNLLPLEQNLAILQYFSFVPGRFTAMFAPNQIAETLAAAQAKGAANGEVAQFFLGNGRPLWWTPLTYAFLHASYTHVGFNCLWLVAFGAAVARRFGNLRFLLFCVATALAGALTHYLTHITDLQPVIGASAIVSGTMAASVRFVFQPGAPLGEGELDPRLSGIAYRQPALPLRAIITDRRAMGFLIAWFFANLLFGLAPQLAGFGGASIAWEAHLGGFIVGLFAFPFFDRAAPELPTYTEPL